MHLKIKKSDLLYLSVCKDQNQLISPLLFPQLKYCLALYPYVLYSCDANNSPRGIEILKCELESDCPQQNHAILKKRLHLKIKKTYCS